MGTRIPTLVVGGAWLAATSCAKPDPMFESSGQLELVPADGAEASLGGLFGSMNRMDGGVDLIGKDPNNDLLTLWPAPLDSSRPQTLRLAHPSSSVFSSYDVDGDGNDDLVLMTNEDLRIVWGPIDPTQSSVDPYLSFASLNPSRGQAIAAHLTDDETIDWLLQVPAQEGVGHGVLALAGTPNNQEAHTPLPINTAFETITAAGVPLVGDLTGNGRNDVLLSTRGRGPVVLVPGPHTLDGNDSVITIFEEVWHNELGVTGMRPNRLVDFDGDGQLDLVADTDGERGDASLWGSGGAAIWLGPLTGPMDVMAPDAVVHSANSDGQWALEAIADTNGDGTQELIFRSIVSGPVLHDECDFQVFGGALASIEMGWRGETELSAANILAYGDAQSGPLGPVFHAGRPDGADRERIGVTLADLGAQWSCTSEGTSQALFRDPSTLGGIGLVTLP